jgi:hypothetical protein
MYFCQVLEMNFIEMLVFVVLSAALVGAGYRLSLKFGVLGWCVGTVPVGLFWAAVLFFTVRRTMQEMKESKR